MIQVFAAAVIWGLVLCLLPSMRRRSDHSIMVAAVTIATALTLNVDTIYLEGDRLLGGRNVLDLVANILMVVGIYFLSRAILRAADPDETMDRRNRGGLALLGLVVVALILSFSLVDAPRTSTSFMKDFGGQWAAAAYSRPASNSLLAYARAARATLACASTSGGTSDQLTEPSEASASAKRP